MERRISEIKKPWYKNWKVWVCVFIDFGLIGSVAPPKEETDVDVVPAIAQVEDTPAKVEEKAEKVAADAKAKAEEQAEKVAQQALIDTALG